MTYIFNAILRTAHSQNQSKVIQILLLPKPEKNVEEVILDRKISLLHTLSNLFEKLFLRRLKPRAIKQLLS